MKFLPKHFSVPCGDSVSVVFYDDIHTFIVVDNNYVEPSLVCLYSFHKHNPDFVVTIYGLDFCEEDIDNYQQHLHDLGITTYKVESISTAGMNFDYKWNIFYSDIINIMSAKFKIMENIEKEKYILYFDTDTIFTDSIKPMFMDLHQRELLGVRYTENKPEINCGIFLAANLHVKYYTMYLDFFNQNRLKYFNIDEMFLSEVYENHIVYLPKEYNTYGFITIEHPRMIHYIGSVKPFMHKNLSNFQCCTPQRYADEWYKVYYKIKNRLNASEDFDKQVAETKAYIENLGNRSLLRPLENTIDKIFCAGVKCGVDILSAIVKHLIDKYNKTGEH